MNISNLFGMTSFMSNLKLVLIMIESLHPQSIHNGGWVMNWRIE